MTGVDDGNGSNTDNIYQVPRYVGTMQYIPPTLEVAAHMKLDDGDLLPSGSTILNCLFLIFFFSPHITAVPGKSR